MVEIIVALILVGVALYIISLIPMDNTVKQIIRVLVIVCVCLWVLDYMGWYSISALHMRR
jgi:hypothetical protein